MRYTDKLSSLHNSNVYEANNIEMFPLIYFTKPLKGTRFKRVCVRKTQKKISFIQTFCLKKHQTHINSARSFVENFPH